VGKKVTYTYITHKVGVVRGGLCQSWRKNFFFLLSVIKRLITFKTIIHQKFKLFHIRRIIARCFRKH
jgi:hypothetical protein